MQPARKTSLATVGTDPMSEVNIRNRLNFMRETDTGGGVSIPRSWVEADPALKQAVEEIDWLTIEESE